MSKPKLTDRLLKDATKPLQLTITPQDIKGSAKGDPANCAAAEACKRQLAANEVLIYRSRAYVLKGKVWTRYIVPESLKSEIVAFDRGARFEPGTYTLGKPSSGSRLGEYHSGKSGPSGGRRTKRPIHRTTNVRHAAESGSGIHIVLGT